MFLKRYLEMTFLQFLQLPPKAINIREILPNNITLPQHECCKTWTTCCVYQHVQNKSTCNLGKSVHKLIEICEQWGININCFQSVLRWRFLFLGALCYFTHTFVRLSSLCASIHHLSSIAMFDADTSETSQWITPQKNSPKYSLLVTGKLEVPRQNRQTTGSDNTACQLRMDPCTHGLG